MSKKRRVDKRFLSEIEEDEIAGGGIPDEDGWVYLQRGRKPKKPAEKPRSRRRTKPKPD